MGTAAGRLLGTHEHDKVKRLAVIERLRAEHPKGKVTVEAVQAYFGKAPNNTPGKRRERVKRDLKNAPHEERVRAAKDLMGDPAVEREIKQRNRREKDWNGKTTPMRERELRQRKRTGDYNELLKFQLDLSRMCNILEDYKADDFAYDDGSLTLAADIHDDLLRLTGWLDRRLSEVQAWIGDKATLDKIAKLRNQTVANGATAAEEATARSLADRLERALEMRKRPLYAV